MPQRLDEFNRKFIYTETNPENIISAKKNALFFRKGEKFYVNHTGEVNGKWDVLPYRTVIIPQPPRGKLIKYKKPQEVWIKTTDGFYDEYKELLPKTGWKFLSYQDVFLKKAAVARKFNWIFPPPTNSFDTIGNNKSRSYDENYFYAKLDGMWYRTPILNWNGISPSGEGPDKPELNTNLPFADTPRFIPLPNNSNNIIGSESGDQTYDVEYFYIRTSKWRRTRLNIYYDANKMARF